MAFVFNFRLRKEKALGAQAGFADAFNKIVDILENIEGLGPVEIKKNGRDWRVVIKDQLTNGGGTAMPDGTTEGDTFKWTGDPASWGVVSPIDDVNSEDVSYIKGDDRLVIGAQVSPNAHLIQLITRAFGANEDDASETEINIGGGDVVSDVVLSTAAGKFLKVTKSPLGPVGDATNVALRWDNGNTKFVKALPIAATNDEQSAEVGAGDRVVVGAKTGATGNLIQLITKPLEDQSGTVPTGYADGTVIVDMQWDSSGKKIQVKTATALVKTGTTSAWTDKITFASFAD